MPLELGGDPPNPGLDLTTPKHPENSEHVATLILGNDCMECWRYLSRNDLRAIVEWCAAVLENPNASP